MLRTWHVGKLQELVKAKKKSVSADGDKQDYLSRYYEGTENGSHEHNIDIGFSDNCSMSFSTVDGEGFIYLYPEQVAHLETILEERRHALSKESQ